MKKRTLLDKYIKWNLFLNVVPLKVLKFKRPKWKKLQKKIQFYLKKKTNKFKKKKQKILTWKKKKIKKVRNYFIVKKVKFYWERHKKSYKKGLQLKNCWQMSIGNILKNNILKKNSLKYVIKKGVTYFLRFFLRLDLFIWKLKISKNIVESSNLISKGLISVNGIQIFDRKAILTQGDILFISPKIYKLDFLQIKNFMYPLLFDFYSNKIIIPQNTENYSFLFNSFLDYDRISYRKLFNFLKKN